MANRILIGNRSTGGYGLYVSKAGSDVLSCAPKDLLFDSRQGVGSGLVYAFGTDQDLSSSGQNFLTTNSKDALGYIPLVVYAEKLKSGWSFSYGGGRPNQVDPFQRYILLSSFVSIHKSPALNT